MKPSNMILVCVVVIVVALMLICVDIIPPNGVSKNVIIDIEIRIGMYYDNNQKLPKYLSDLPLREGHDNSLKDYWGNPIIYEYDSNLNVKLISLGKDGKTGGVGYNADIVCEFTVPLTSVIIPK